MAWVDRRTERRRQPQRLPPMARKWIDEGASAFSGLDITRNISPRALLGNGTVSGSVTRTFATGGFAANFAASAEVQLDASRFLFGTDRNFAMMAVVRRASAQLYRFAIRAASSTTYDLTAGIGCEFSGSGKMVFNIGLKNYDEFEIAETTQLVDGEIGAYVGTWNAATQTAKLFKNGVLQNSLNYTSASNSPRSIPISIGNDPASTAGRYWNGDLYLAAFFDALVPDAMAMQLSANPWQVFEDKTHRAFRAAASAGFLARYYYDMIARGGHFGG